VAFLAVPFLLPARAAAAQGRIVEERTRSVVATYDKAEHWAMKGIVLLTLGPSWSRAAQPMLMDAISSKDPQLQAYGLEVLATSEPEILRYGLTVEIIDELVKEHAKVKSEAWYARVEEVLFALFPGNEALDAGDWSKHWRSVRREWQPTAWPEAFTEEEDADAKAKGDGKTVAQAFIARAFDLYNTGLEVMLVIDSTGSMQPTIDLTRASLMDMAAVLQGVAPKLQMGVVHYKDYGDFGDGAKLLEELSKKPAKVEKALDKLRASGGGDMPEAIEAGLRVALDEESGWSRSASKLIVVIGDAPAQRQSEAEDLARGAHQKPFGNAPVIPDGNASTVSPNRPFVVSTILVRHGGGRGGGGGGAAGGGNNAANSLRAIAEAGGGSYAEISAVSERDPTMQIVAQVLAQSFGRKFRDQTDIFLDVWLRYHRDGVFE
jgi:hypothetical protein